MNYLNIYFHIENGSLSMVYTRTDIYGICVHHSSFIFGKEKLTRYIYDSTIRQSNYMFRELKY